MRLKIRKYNLYLFIFVYIFFSGQQLLATELCSKIIIGGHKLTLGDRTARKAKLPPSSLVHIKANSMFPQIDTAIDILLLSGLVEGEYTMRQAFVDLNNGSNTNAVLRAMINLHAKYKITKQNHLIETRSQKQRISVMRREVKSLISSFMYRSLESSLKLINSYPLEPTMADDIRLANEITEALKTYNKNIGLSIPTDHKLGAELAELVDRALPVLSSRSKLFTQINKEVYNFITSKEVKDLATDYRSFITSQEAKEMLSGGIDGHKKFMQRELKYEEDLLVGLYQTLTRKFNFLNEYFILELVQIYSRPNGQLLYTLQQSLKESE